MKEVLKFLSEQYPVIGIVIAAIVLTGVVVWWAGKFYHKIKYTETEVKEVKDEVREVAVKMEEKIAECAKKTDIIALKENDFFHTNKALLLMATELLKNNPERFERVKDTILESTPDSRKEDIKAITL